MSTVYTYDVSGITWRYTLSGTPQVATIGDGTIALGNATTSGTGLSGAISIPSTLNNKTVTSIGEYAFRLCDNITSVTIPDSVTSIGVNAFVYCRYLTSVTIGTSVTSIGNSAFYGCSRLTSVTFPDSVTSIDEFAFYGCTILTSINIPDSVTTISSNVFRSCRSLTSMTIPNLVASIGEYAFYECTSLTSINIPNSVTSIGTDAFGLNNAALVITMNTGKFGKTSPSSNQTFFGGTSVDFVLPPPPPLTMTITSTTSGVTSGSTTNNATIALTFTSSASTTDFVVGDISVTNGSLSAFAASSATVYTATFTPNDQGVCTINVPANRFTAAGQNNIASNTFTWTYDSISPTMDISSTTLGVTRGSTTKTTPIELRFTSTEATNNFAVEDISFNNGTLSNFASSSPTVYTATFTPNGPGPVACTIDVLAGAYTDAATNLNNLATQFAFTFDSVPPNMDITANVANNATTNNETIALTFTASEAITGFALEDISFNKGSLTDFASSSPTVYTATFTQGGQGEHTINVPVGSYNDAAGNSNTDAAVFNWTYDSVSPTMTITSTTAGVTSGSTTKTTPIALTFTSNEATNNFAVEDISVANGTLSNFASISSTVYTATFTPNGPGPVACTIDVAAGAYTDAATNLNNLATQFAFTFDSVPPTMAITSTTSGVVSGSTTNNETIALTFTSSKATTNFAVEDISVTNGTLSAFASTSPTVYTATFAPTRPGACTVAVASSVYTDAAGNNNAAGNTFSFGYIPNFAEFNNANNLEQTYIAGFLDVSGTVIHRTGDLTVMDGNMLVSSGNVSLNSGNLNMAGNVSINSSLMVNGPTTLQQLVASTNIDVSGTTTLVGAVSVAGLTTFNNNVGIANNKKFTVGSGTSAFGGDVSMNSALRVAGDVSLNSTLDVNGLTTLANTSIAGTLVVNGKSTFTTDMSFTAVNFDICGNLRAQYPANSIPLSAIIGGGSLTAADVSMNAGLSVAGATTLSTLTAKGNTAFGGALTVTGAATLAELTATGTVAVGDTLVVTEKTNFGNDVAFNGSRVDICGNLYANYPVNSIPASAIMSSGSSNTFNADISMNANLSVAGATTLASSLVVAGKTTFLNDVSMGNVSGSRVDICGNLYATYIANSIRQSAIIGGVGGGVFNNDVSMNARLSVKNSINIDSAQMQYIGIWNQIGGDIDGQPGSLSGMAVSLSNDGSRVAIGNRNQALPIRVYTRDINNAIGWSQLGGDISLNPVGDTYYAHNVVLSGDGSIVAVYMYSPLGSSAGGTAKALVFQFQSGSWVKLGNTLDSASPRGGTGIALSNDGLTIAVGAPQTTNGSTNNGRVAVYRYNGSAWIQLGSNITGNAANAFFGWAVALSSDGNIVAVGAAGSTTTNAGYVAAYSYNGSTWTQLGANLTGTTNSRFGAYVSLSADGTILAASSGFQSLARAYKYTTSWALLGAEFTVANQGGIDGGTTIYVGIPISLSRDGTTLAIGTYTTNETFVYRCPVGSSTWTQVGSTILGETSGDFSGSSIALSGDGLILAIGAINNDGTSASTTNNCGHVRVYSNNVSKPAGLDIGANVIPTALTTSNLTISSTLNVSGSTTLAALTAGSTNIDTLFVTGATTTATLTSGNTNIGGTLFLTAATTFPADVSLNSTLAVTSDVSVNSPLFVGNDAALNSTLFVNRAGSLNSTLFVNGATTLASVYASTLSVTGATTMTDTAYVTGNSTINGLLALVSPYTFAADASLNSRVTIARDVSLNATLNVGGATTLTTLTMPNNMTLNSTLNVVGATTIVLDVSANARLLVTGATTLNSTLTVANTTNLSGTLRVTDATTASTLTASGVTTIGGILTVTGKTSIAGATTFNSTTVDVSGNLNARTLGFPSGGAVVQHNPIVNWLQLGGDIDGEAPQDESGFSIALSADGSIVAIGAYKNDAGTNDFGHVRVYQRNAINTTVAPIGWTQLGGDIDGEVAQDQSGFSVALSADGTIVAIGANQNDGTNPGTVGDNRGHVRVYKYRADKTAAVANQTLNTFGPIGWDRLGADIDAEAVFDQSGYSVSLSADGSTVAICANRNDGTTGTDSGHVRVYKYLQGKVEDTNQSSPTFGPAGWTRLGADIDGEAANDYGQSVYLSADGSIVAIGANANDGTGALTTDERGHVRVYKYVQGKAADTNQSSPTFGPAGWTRLGADIDGEAAGDESGRSISLSADGFTVAIGAWRNDGTSGNDRGHVRVYKYVDGKAADTNQSSPTFGPAGWIRLGDDIDGEAANDQSGQSVSLSADGSIVAIGAYFNDGTNPGTVGDNRGHVRVYKYLEGKIADTNQSSPTFGPAGWTRLGPDIDGEAAVDQFGWSVSLSGDGTTLAVGANFNDGTSTSAADNRGHVRVFKYLPSGLLSNTPLISTNAITTGDVTLYDNFNVTRATSLTGTLSIVGATTLSNMNTSSDASVGGALTVSGATTSTGALNINGATTSTTMTLSSNAVIGGTLIVSGATTMQTLNVMGPIKKL